MSDMLRIAKADITTAKLLSHHYGDEVFLNIAGYHCSQAAEKLVKSYIISKGVIPLKTHKIFELINYIQHRGIYNIMLDKISDYALKIDAWYSETRYTICYLATKEDIVETLDILGHLSEKMSEVTYDNVSGIKHEVTRHSKRTKK